MTLNVVFEFSNLLRPNASWLSLKPSVAFRHLEQHSEIVGTSLEIFGKCSEIVPNNSVNPDSIETKF